MNHGRLDNWKNARLAKKEPWALRDHRGIKMDPMDPANHMDEVEKMHDPTKSKMYTVVRPAPSTQRLWKDHGREWLADVDEGTLKDFNRHNPIRHSTLYKRPGPVVPPPPRTPTLDDWRK